VVYYFSIMAAAAQRALQEAATFPQQHDSISPATASAVWLQLGESDNGIMTSAAANASWCCNNAAAVSTNQQNSASAAINHIRFI